MMLIVITSEEFFADECAALNLLFENGLEVLHLRKPSASADETKGFIEQIDVAFHCRVVLHDNYALTKDFNLKGVHLNRRNKDVSLSPASSLTSVSGAEVNAACMIVQQDKSLSVSRSCHSLNEVMSSKCYDYVFLSPIFDSISKVGYNHGFTPEQLCEAKDTGIINEKVMALGGITSENIPLVRRYGFGGVVVLGTLWCDFAKDGNADSLLRRFNELKTKCEEK